MDAPNRFRKRFPASGSRDVDPMKHKKIKAYEGRGHSYAGFSTTWRSEFEKKRSDYCFQDSGEFGSVTKDIQELIMKNRKFLDSIYALDPTLSHSCLSVQIDVASTELITPNIIDIDDDHDGTKLALKQIVPAVNNSDLLAPVIIIDSDSDSDDFKNDDHKSNYLESKLQPSPKLLMKDFLDWSSSQNQSSVNKVASVAAGPGSGSSRSQSSAKRVASIAVGPGSNHPRNQSLANEAPNVAAAPELSNDRGEYVGTDDDMHIDESGEMSDTNSDGLGDIWSEMNVALECSKDATEDTFLDGREDDGEEECEHSFILKDDIGDVCRICGVIRRGIEKIIEYNFSKGSRSTRTYRYEGRTTREIDQPEIIPDGFKSSVEFVATEINPHPRHMKEMKPHQIDGFNFLLSNLVTDNPGGCIMAHAPGSGKTFMIISFLQSFMAKYPAARPLVVLPKGILTIWKKEFLRWQVEDLPLYDFYSGKADSRLQQLEIIKKWAEERSILFLGYKQFSTIICDTEGGEVAAACQNYLLKVPSILILDEGHTPRNQDTDILTSLERVETTRKVVLSGTLYQNHVKEVFNILNLVRPRFLKLDRSKVIKKRILSRVEITGRRNLITENDFYELIEHTLTKDENQTRKLTVIKDLREMTKQVLHYYKGDNLGELPGLVDFSVFLRLHPKQQSEVQRLKTLGRKFSITSQGSAIYMHPRLKTLAKGSDVKDRVDEEKISAILDDYDIREGVKASFYMNLLQLCESTGEKLLVFSQYLLPLKFLEKLSAKEKGYSSGREMFMITGDSDTETRESSMDKFNNSPEARVFFGSIRACGEGISLVGASRIMILDVPLNPSVTRQAIGRAFRPGQVRKVYTYMLIASGSPEEDDHKICFRKESISKHWFELDHCSGSHKFEMDKVEVENCGDLFLESARLNENIVGLLKR